MTQPEEQPESKRETAGVPWRDEVASSGTRPSSDSAQDGAAPDTAPAPQPAAVAAEAPAESPSAEEGGRTGLRWPRPQAPRRLAMHLLALAALAGLVVAAFTVPVNKVIEAPGPTWNVLDDGSAEGTQELVTITGTQTYPADGALRMTTVSMTGCPGFPVTTVNVIMAWFSPSSAVLDRDEVCPEDMTAEKIESQNQAQMAQSQDAAVVAALIETGLATSMTLTVSNVAEQQTSSGIQQNDVLVSLTPEGGSRTQVTTFGQLRETMTTIPQGTKVTLEVLRDGRPTTTTLTTLPPEEGSKGSLLGLGLTIEADSEVEASFDLSDVGGPSAGMMFALGIVDKVTPGSLTGGQDIAGTGTISADGRIGPIGGIQQKMAGAASSGASYFLAPADNCAEVLDHEPDGLQVFAVSTLHEAVQAVEAIAAGSTSEPATCSSLQAESD